MKLLMKNNLDTMKNMLLYPNRNMQQVCKYGLAAMIFFMGTFPMSAQDEAEAPVAPAKREVKSQKKYPMVEIKGKVLDAATGEPLAGVQIKAFNNSFYTAMTDEDGTYTISVPVFVTSLSAKLDGYSLIQTPIGGRTENVDMNLYSDKFLGDYTSHVSASKSVGTTGFEQSTAVSIEQEIQNRLGADVRSISRSAVPGVGMSMFINGYNSLNANAQPLIVIDGVIHDMLYDKDMIHEGYFNNILAGVSMDDIESVEVLKNGTAIYGAKAANGVILINTKRNKSMATRIDVNLSAGVELVPKFMDMMNASQYRAYTSELLGSTGTKLTDFKFLNDDPNYYYYNMYHNNTDWVDEVYKEAITQNYGIHIQGGDDVANYNLSVGYTNAQATLKENDFTRFNIRFNTDIVLSKWITTRFDASYSNITRNLRDNGLSSDFSSVSVAAPGFLALAKAPFLSPYDFSTDGKPSTFYSDADTYLSEVLGSSASLANPVAILKNADDKNKNSVDNTIVNIAVTPKWQPTKNFSVQERFSYTMESFNEDYYTPVIGMPSFNLENKGRIDNTKSSLFTKHNAIFSDTRFDWAIPLGAHRLDVFGGVRYMNDTFSSSNFYGYNTGNDKTPNLSTGLQYKETIGVDDSWNSLAYYANVDYNYKEKYYLQGSLSMETSSRFGKETDAGLKFCNVAWGLFPSIQGAWVISNESWFHPNKGVNMLKVNAGFESVGNDAIDNNATITYMAGKSFLGNSVSGIGITNIGNTKLRWETTNRFNAGLEGNFINNRLNLKFNYFYSKTNNLLTLGTLAYVAGLEDYWTNDGAMKNQGFDFAFNAKVVDAPKFKFELGASMGHYKNELTKLPEGKEEFTTDMYNATILSKVGMPVGVFYGYKTNGVFETTEEATAAGLYMVNSTGGREYFKAGDMRFVDFTGEGEISDADRTVIGDPNPDIYGNIHANFFIGKHWAVSANFNYCIGNDIYNYQRALLESGSAFMNQTTSLTGRWMAEGQTTDIPKITYGDPMSNARFSDRWIEDGSYLKLKNVTVSYKLPIQNQYIQGLTIWAAGNNLFTISKYLGSDPEVSCANGVLYQGIDTGCLTYGRSFTLGVKINL